MSNQSITVLLVEDDEVWSKVMARQYLGGYHFEIAETLQRAKEIIESVSIDVILLDLTLEDSRGIKTFVQVSEQFNEIPVIILTGDTREDVAHEAMVAGAQDFLIKSRLSEYLIEKAIRNAIIQKAIEVQLYRELERVRGRYEALADFVKALWLSEVESLTTLPISDECEGIFQVLRHQKSAAIQKLAQAHQVIAKRLDVSALQGMLSEDD